MCQVLQSHAAKHFEYGVDWFVELSDWPVSRLLAAASVAIRAISADGGRNTIALIYRPSAGGREQHFVFGGWYSGLTGELRTFLDEWVKQIDSYEFTETTPWDRWHVSYDDAVANIDLLADRLRTALMEIPKLSNDG